MAKLIDLDGLAHVYSIIKGMLADKLGKNDTAVNASKVNNLTVETAVPKNAKFTDTVYTHPSTHPASMITGLSTVATSGSYNDLTNKPTIPSAYTLPTASTTVMGGVKIGSNISVSNGVISLNKSNVTSALGYTPPTSDTVYDNATTSTAGLMSASDKVKLNSIAANANNYTHPSTHPASMITGLASVATSGSYNDLTDKPTIPAASTVDSELSSTSTNPVQNKVIKAALDGKLGKNAAAASANKLNTNGGSATQPIYFANGVPVATTYTLGKSVPSDAKFTDTVYNHPTTHPASMITGLSTVATSGSYSDLSNKPTIPVVPTKVSAFMNDAGYLTQHQSLDGYAKTSVANTWTAEQSLNNVNITYERYTASSISGTSTSATPTASTAVYTATGNFTLYLNSIASKLANGQTTVFTAYINANADYALSISVTGVVKYIGNASDVAITSAGLLLNIMMLKDASGNVTSIVQASKLS